MQIITILNNILPTKTQTRILSGFNFRFVHPTSLFLKRDSLLMSAVNLLSTFSNNNWRKRMSVLSNEETSHRHPLFEPEIGHRFFKRYSCAKETYMALSLRFDSLSAENVITLKKRMYFFALFVWRIAEVGLRWCSDETQRLEL
ncbi:hypothetical protein CEXT_620611 [Caerostris extrusa]|uniref:Uncharacterized protein n=1 Tax=Caerostris extrusa TaxID=172846 RepID=A0AAV4QES1_CAEEX|nr:hypothetical protein CEXT_620611 [Caerostris extrusa]